MTRRRIALAGTAFVLLLCPLLLPQVRAFFQPGGNARLHGSGIAGTYNRSFGFVGDSLTIKSSAKFSIEGWTCVSSWKEFGIVNGSAQSLTLLTQESQFNLATRMRDAGSRVPPAQLIPVAWGDLLYLVHSDGMLDFCNEINLGLEPRNGAIGETYLKQDDWNKPAHGCPSLPAEWLDYLLPAPVTATVVAVDSSDTFTLDVGASSGLRPGMVLLLADAKARTSLKPAQLRIEAVHHDHSVARCNVGQSKPSKGQRYTSHR